MSDIVNEKITLLTIVLISGIPLPADILLAISTCVITRHKPRNALKAPQPMWRNGKFKITYYMTLPCTNGSTSPSRSSLRTGCADGKEAFVNSVTEADRIPKNNAKVTYIPKLLK